MYYSYSKPCSSLPYKEAQVKFLTERMKQVGYDDNFPVVIWNGSILDGRHRYNAAELAGIDPVFTTFKGTEQEAWDYVTATNVDGTRHINNEEKKFFYVQRADALGVQERGGERGNQYQSGNVSNDTMAPSQDHQSGNTPNGVMAPSQQEHADSLGVHLNTINRWEKERKEIAADPELSLMTSTPEGYKDAKKQLRARNAEVIREFQSLTEDQKVERMGGDEVVDKFKQYELDHSIEKDFDPHACSIGILQSANRLRIWGGKAQVKQGIMQALSTSVRMQTYEAAALLLLAEVIEENRLEIEALTQTKINLRELN